MAHLLVRPTSSRNSHQASSSKPHERLLTIRFLWRRPPRSNRLMGSRPASEGFCQVLILFLGIRRGLRDFLLRRGSTRPSRASSCRGFDAHSSQRTCASWNYATAASPFFSTKVSSLSEAPEGRFSPRSHLLTRLVVTFR